MICARCGRDLSRAAYTVKIGWVIKRYGPKCSRLLKQKATAAGQMDLWEVVS